MATLAMSPGLAHAQTPDPSTPAPGTQAVPPEKPAPDALGPDPVRPDAPPTAAAPMKPVAPAPGQPATFTDTLRPTFVAQTPDDMVTSKLVGQTITNAGNESIGEIADVVIGFDGKVRAWVVGVGGFLGIGTKYVAVDPSALRLQRSDGKTLTAMINTDKDQLRAAPEYIYLGKEKPKDDAGKGNAAK